MEGVNLNIFLISILNQHSYSCSISEERDEASANIVEHAIELFLSVKSVPLAESGVIVADVLENFPIESLTNWRHRDNASSDSS